jgi:glycosyltransferase involved in cell wall biosynthesis
VVLATLYPTDPRRIPGGLRAVAYNLVQGLREWPDLDVHVVHCHSEVDRDRDVVDGNVTVHYRAMPRQRLVPNTLRAIGRVEGLLRELEPDVVNAHVAHYAVAALRAGYTPLLTIHGVLEREAQIYKSTLFDRGRFVLETWLERYALRRVRDVVAISPYVLEQYRTGSRARFHRIDNPLPNEFFTVPDLTAPPSRSTFGARDERRGDGAEEGRLLYAGTIDERKNVLDLLRALLIVRQDKPDVVLRVAGRTTSAAYDRAVREFVAAQGLQRNVEFLGLQDKDRLLDEYARCAVVLLASVQETAPMTVIEAMAAGKPVVATRVGGVPHLVENGSSGFTVAAGDVESLASRVLTLLDDRDLRRRMGQRGRELAQRFRVETVADAYRRLYYELAGRAAP